MFQDINSTGIDDKDFIKSMKYIQRAGDTKSKRSNFIQTSSKQEEATTCALVYITFFSEIPDTLYHRLQLLIQEQGGKDKKIDESVAIIDKLLQYNSISQTEHTNISFSFIPK